MFGKIIGISFCLAAILTRAGAQEFGLQLDGGLQGMHYPLANGQTKILPAGSLGLRYTFHLHKQFGLLTGISGGLYRSEASFPNGFVFSYNKVDDAGSAFRLDEKVIGYKEKQQFFAASIPLLLQYQSTGEGMQWYLNAGGKLFIPINSSVDISAQELTLSGYYPDFNVEVSNLPQHGFGSFHDWKASTEPKLKPSAALSGAAGVSFPVSPGTRLYAGLYTDIGLTDLKKNNGNMPLVTYNPGGVTGSQANGTLNMSNAGSATLLAFGIQLRLSFGSTPVKAATPPPPISNDEADIIQETIIFGLLGETSIPEIQKPRLDEVANLLKQYPDIRILIVGHYCNSETEKETRKTGEARARAVSRYLQGKGIDKSRMESGPAAESDPVLPGDPNANFQNRRVVILLK